MAKFFFENRPYFAQNVWFMRNLEVKSICKYFLGAGKMCNGRECLRGGVCERINMQCLLWKGLFSAFCKFLFVRCVQLRKNTRHIFWNKCLIFWNTWLVFFTKCLVLFAAGGKNEYSTACFAVSRCFDVSECRVFFRKTAWRAAVSFPGCFLAGMNRKMCVAEILVLKSVKFISGRFNYVVNFALYKIISLKRFISENKKLHYAA